MKLFLALGLLFIQVVWSSVGKNNGKNCSSGENQSKTNAGIRIGGPENSALMKRRAAAAAQKKKALEEQQLASKSVNQDDTVQEVASEAVPRGSRECQSDSISAVKQSNEKGHDSANEKKVTNESANQSNETVPQASKNSLPEDVPPVQQQSQLFSSTKESAPTNSPTSSDRVPPSKGTKETRSAGNVNLTVGSSAKACSTLTTTDEKQNKSSESENDKKNLKNASCSQVQDKPINCWARGTANSIGLFRQPSSSDSGSAFKSTTPTASKDAVERKDSTASKDAVERKDSTASKDAVERKDSTASNDTVERKDSTSHKDSTVPPPTATSQKETEETEAEAELRIYKVHVGEKCRVSELSSSSSTSSSNSSSSSASSSITSSSSSLFYSDARKSATSSSGVIDDVQERVPLLAKRSSSSKRYMHSDSEEQPSTEPQPKCLKRKSHSFVSFPSVVRKTTGEKGAKRNPSHSWDASKCKFEYTPMSQVNDSEDGSTSSGVRIEFADKSSNTVESSVPTKASTDKKKDCATAAASSSTTGSNSQSTATTSSNITASEESTSQKEKSCDGTVTKRCFLTDKITCECHTQTEDETTSTKENNPNAREEEELPKTLEPRSFDIPSPCDCVATNPISLILPDSNNEDKRRVQDITIEIENAIDRMFERLKIMTEVEAALKSELSSGNDNLPKNSQGPKLIVVEVVEGSDSEIEFTSESSAPTYPLYGDRQIVVDEVIVNEFTNRTSEQLNVHSKESAVPSEEHTVSATTNVTSESSPKEASKITDEVVENQSENNAHNVQWHSTAAVVETLPPVSRSKSSEETTTQTTAPDSSKATTSAGATDPTIGILPVNFYDNPVRDTVYQPCTSNTTPNATPSSEEVAENRERDENGVPLVVKLFTRLRNFLS